MLSDRRSAKACPNSLGRAIRPAMVASRTRRWP